MAKITNNIQEEWSKKFNESLRSDLIVDKFITVDFGFIKETFTQKIVSYFRRRYWKVKNFISYVMDYGKND